MSAAGDEPTSQFTVLESIDRFQGRVIGLRTDRMQMPDGSVSDRDVVTHPGAVAIVALDSDDRIVLVRQHRQPVGRLMEEIPAGLLDVAGEPALLGAQRELQEEALLAADQWHVLLDLHPSPGMTDEAVRVYLAQGLSAVVATEGFEPEHEEVTMTRRWRPLRESVAAALSGELTNAITVAGILATAAAQAGGWSGLRPPDSFWPAHPNR